jgi:hypothetical protein
MCLVRITLLFKWILWFWCLVGDVWYSDVQENTLEKYFVYVASWLTAGCVQDLKSVWCGVGYVGIVP